MDKGFLYFKDVVIKDYLEATFSGKWNIIRRDGGNLSQAVPSMPELNERLE